MYNLERQKANVDWLSWKKNSPALCKYFLSSLFSFTMIFDVESNNERWSPKFSQK